MEGISDIRIVGLDDKRPPKIRAKPYIDLFFKLSHKAPADWCGNFNSLSSKLKGSVRIDAEQGLFIEAWVRSPDEISPFLDQLKLKVAECTREYIQRIANTVHDNDQNNTEQATEGGEQGRLNAIIAALNFDDAPGA